MIRVGSQLTFCSPNCILRRAVVEIDENNIITQLFSLDNSMVEPSQTLFFDGILTSEIVSIKQNILSLNMETVVSKYNYFDFSEELFITEIKPKDKPLVLDFGNNSPGFINQLMFRLVPALNAFTIFEIIAACTYYPALILGQKAELKKNRENHLLLWQNVDLINECLTISSKIFEMN